MRKKINGIYQICMTFKGKHVLAAYYIPQFEDI